MATKIRTGKKAGVYNLDALLTEVRKRRQRLNGDGKAQTKVGYTAPYAVPVHERLDVYHPNGQAKFLEQPIRTELKIMGDIIVSRLRARERLKQAQQAAALHLIRVSLNLVPYDTGFLHGSWFIK